MRVRFGLTFSFVALIGCGGGTTGQTGNNDLSGRSDMIAAAGDGATQTSPSDGGVSTASVGCSYSYNMMNSSASVNHASTVSWSCTSTQRTMTSNDIPDHDTGTFPNQNCPNTITAQTYNAQMALAPAKAASTSTNLHVVGFATNGVKFDPSTAGTCSVSGSATNCTLIGNTGTWNIEALGQTSFNFGVDSSNAHVQPDGSYHYHGMPEATLSKLNKGMAMTLVGWALDGFPIYARYGYTNANDATSGIKVIVSSYQTKAAADAGRPSTTTYPMGTFTQDWQYNAGSGDLDECNGRVGVTPEFPNGIYHYIITDTYPFIGRCLKGTVSLMGMP